MRPIIVFSSRTGQALRMLAWRIPVSAAISSGFFPPAVERLDRPENSNDWASLAARCRGAFVISLGFMYKIPALFFEHVETVNVHPGKLPEFKGKDPHLQALKARVEYTAVSIHRVTEEIDGGEVLVSVPVRISPRDYFDPKLLDNRLRTVAVSALCALIEGIAV